MHMAIVVLKNWSDWTDTASALCYKAGFLFICILLDASISDDVTTTWEIMKSVMDSVFIGYVI